MKILYKALMDFILVVAMIFGLFLFASGIYYLTHAHAKVDDFTGYAFTIIGIVVALSAWTIQRIFVHPKDPKQK